MNSINNTSPKGYLSWSQLSLYERSQDEYYKQYIQGYSGYNSKYMSLGKRLSEAREKGSDSDNVIDYLANFMQTYPKREYEIRATFEGIPLFGKLDGWNPYKKIIGEDKSGKKFTQAMADNLGQLTMYSLLVWCKYKKFPDIRLHWAETVEENGIVRFTGKFKTFETKRDLKDIIKFSKRLKVAWAGICEMGKELIKERN
jgi:hypothetical protein